MRSKASIKGRPLHPALVHFPIAFMAGALIFDGLGLATARPGLWATGGHLALAGVVTALAAAIPGLIDYLRSVPPKSSAKARATKHMAVMLTAVGLVAVAAWLRPAAPMPPNVVVLVLELVAVGLIAVGGEMGGTLVTRNQIGIDHRYANAGKWREERVDGPAGQPLMVARADDLEVDQMKLVHVGGLRIVLGRTEDGWVAFADRCPHRGGSLADGVLMCGTVQCPWHGSQFDVRTGAVGAGPAEGGIAVYRVEVRGGEVLLLPAGWPG